MYEFFTAILRHFTTLAHATKKTTRTIRKTKPKARRRGAVPANPLWGSAAAFSAAHGFLSLVFTIHCTYEFALFRSAMVA